MTFLPIAGSIFASNIGATVIVGLGGSAAATGFAPILFEWCAAFMMVLLGWVFVPIYTSSGSYTMPEYIGKRYGGRRLRIYYAFVQLLLILLLGISAEMYAGSLFVELILGWNVYLSTLAILAMTAIYTLGGGLAAVIYTDALQTVIIIIGSMILSILALNEIGGYQAMIGLFKKAASNSTYWQEETYSNASCGFPPEDSFHILRGMRSSFPWPGLVFGLVFFGIYYFCTNQVIVQRNLAAKNISHSKAACVVNSYLKILPFFLFCWPGMISRILYPDEVACADPVSCTNICNNPAGCTNIAYPLLVVRLLPPGIKGLMLAALLAAIMSSLTSNFNSSSSVFTMDIWRLMRPKASQKEFVLVGRIFGAIMIGLSIAWLPILHEVQGGQLWDYFFSVSSYITPPWVIVFVLGIFWKRCTEQGAFWGLMAGLVVGICRMGVHFAYAQPYCGGSEPDLRPAIYTEVHYLMFAIILGACTLIVTVAVSLVTQPRPANKLHRVTWWTRKSPQQPQLTDDEDEEEEEKEEEKEDEEEHKDLHVEAGVSPKTDQTWTTRGKASGALYKWFCGKKQTPHLTKAERRQQYNRMTCIKENPTWSKVCDINAAIAIAVTCFLIGYYG